MLVLLKYQQFNNNKNEKIVLIVFKYKRFDKHDNEKK